MKKMMAQRLYGPKDLRWIETELPDLRENEVLVRVKFCGICGTDESIYSGESTFWADGLIHTPMTLGHEYSGVVESVGKNVTNFKPGDRVVADTGISCGTCDTCREGNYLGCKHMKAVGTINAHDGGYAEYAVMPERHLYKLPDNISFEQGAVVEPVATGLYAVKMGQIKMGDTVLVIGTGPIGLGATPFVGLYGASKVIVVGRKEFKLELAKKFGANYTINTTKEDLYERVMEITGSEGVDVVIESSGSVDMLYESVRVCKNYARISCVAFYEKPVTFENFDNMTIHGIQILTVMGSPNMNPIVLKMMESGKVDFTQMITQVIPLSEARLALDDLKANSGSRIKILLQP